MEVLLKVFIKDNIATHNPQPIVPNMEYGRIEAR